MLIHASIPPFYRRSRKAFIKKACNKPLKVKKLRETRCNKRNLILGLFALMLASITASTLIPPALAQPPTIYLDPSNNTFGESTTVGTKFNVTVWCANVTVDILGAQITLRFNDSIINVTRWWAPTWDSSFFMPAPITPLPTPPNPGYVHVGAGQGYVKVAVAKGGLPPTAPWGTNGTIAIFEFNITAVPPEGGQLTSSLSINNIDTYLKDTANVNIPDVVKEDGSYVIIPEYTMIILLSFFAVSTATVVFLKRKRIIQRLNHI